MVALAVAEVVPMPLPVSSADENSSSVEEFCARLWAENDRLRNENGRLRGERDRLKARVKELEVKVEELRRASKRQAAPFSRGDRNETPGRPGRRPGGEYGRKAHRRAPEQVDEELEAPLQDRCGCGGEIRHERTVFQYQEELPEPRPHRRRYAVHIGRCECCGRRHQGRHPFQTSDALGAAGSMLGPRAVALATQLNKELGLSPQKTARTLELVGVPHALRRILLDGLALRDQREEEIIDAQKFGLRVAELERRAGELELGREPQLEGSANPADRDQRDPHRPPAARRSDRAIGPSTAPDRTNRLAAAAASRPRQPGQARGIDMAARAPLPELRYRIVCYELADDQLTVILDATAQGFIAVTGTIADDGTMHGEGTHAGPLPLQRRLARLIADDGQQGG